MFINIFVNKNEIKIIEIKDLYLIHKLDQWIYQIIFNALNKKFKVSHL